ncbi:Na+/H+ antiporter NhaC family protein [Sansalvadorimonas verongulae]|uniref:Na+/H+ antiporter NhaC family protein n=1 Tax=Sansalvadorimonas verongulae TaxID=2172824 RepID=UPI0012BB95D5|nr:Na+/H+ antiporter NhaC family protein [Sansalvadorimonas verongulae]MTI14421.1 Na+/H+ antiporter NhaC family protein [Sansalvadorimonas verongulae]
MDLLSYATSPLSVLAPAVAIGLAVLTRKTLLSLGAGAVVGALLLTGFNPLNALQYLAHAFAGVFWEDGGLNTGKVFILLFPLSLGVMTSCITLAGGTQAFGEWARTRIRTGKGAQITTVILGLIIFIDDYFNALTVGNVSRPLTDRNNVPRAKLAYLLDSTASPVCVITPISSWGAYIISLIGGILVAHGLTDTSAISAFVSMIPMNLYAVFTLLMVFAVASMDLNIGPMKAHAERAMRGELGNVNPLETETAKGENRGTVADLALPISLLVIATVAAMMYTGGHVLQANGEVFSVLGAFKNTDVATSLVFGGVIGILTCVAMLMRQGIAGRQIKTAFVDGARSMSGSIYILVLAWILTGVIGELETGRFLAGLIGDSLGSQWLPALMFLLTCVMGLATGSSWGTFGIMLPIAGDMAAASDMALLLPTLAAVLAGSVFGDHSSPISDTTILSSTGAGCDHIDHVTTQVPYAATVALICLAGYTTIGFTESVALGFGVSSVAFLAVVALFYKISSTKSSKVYTPVNA